MNVDQAIRKAEEFLPGVPVADGIDPRWQAIIQVGEFIEAEPEPVWRFVERWGASADADLRAAIATCLLEHLLEHHFDAYFPRVEIAVRSQPLFAACFSRCWPFGQADAPTNRPRFEALKHVVAAA